jgi:hypothetical protein
MAINKAMVTGTKGLMDWLDRNAISPYYSVWCGKQLLFSWNDDDKEAGSNKLESDLYAIEQNGVGDLLTVKLHPKKEKGGFITDKTPIYASLNFRPAELERSNMYGMQPMGSVNSRLESMLEKMLENQAIMMQQDADEDEDIVERPKSGIEALIDSPHVQGLIIAGLSKMFKLDNQPTGIAGINETNANEALVLLSNLMDKGVTVDHLKKLDQMSNAKLQSLLIML